MQQSAPTNEQISQWKKVWSQYKDRLKPNRKSGQDVIDYLFSRYPLTEVDDETLKEVVTNNIMCNEVYKEKLPEGQFPSPRVFYLDNIGHGKHIYKQQDPMYKDTKIFIGVDTVSGHFHIEGSSLLWDEVCAYQGVDEYDIQNFYYVAEYISCLKRFDLLNSILNS